MPYPTIPLFVLGKQKTGINILLVATYSTMRYTGVKAHLLPSLLLLALGSTRLTPTQLIARADNARLLPARSLLQMVLGNPLLLVPTGTGSGDGHRLTDRCGALGLGLRDEGEVGEVSGGAKKGEDHDVCREPTNGMS